MIPRSNRCLSLAQEVALDEQLRTSTVRAGNTLFALRVQGEVDATMLEFAMNRVIKRHEVLQCAFVPCVSIGGLTFGGWKMIRRELPLLPPATRIWFTPQTYPAADAKLRVVDLTGIHQDQSEEIAKIADWAISEPFDYDHPPFLRAKLALLRPTTVLLIVGVSHLVFDGWSLTIFQRELEEFYIAALEKRKDSLPDLPIQYSDYAFRQKAQLRESDLAALVESWRDRFDRFPPISAWQLPFSREPATHQRGALESTALSIPAEFHKRLRRFGAARRLTPFVLYLAAFMTAVHLVTQELRFSVISHFANRNDHQSQDLIGLFATAQLIGVEFSSEIVPDQVIAAIQQAVHHARAFEELPLTLLHRLAEVQAGRTPRGKVFRSAITFQYRPERPRMFDPKFHTELVTLPLNVASVPIRLMVFERQTSLDLAATFEVTAFKTEDVTRFLEKIRSVLEQFVQGAERDAES